jgi:hypothetical protein
MSTDLPTPCVANPELWESVDPADHRTARGACLNECTRLAWCAEVCKQTQRDYGYGPQVGPRGTWAGRLLDPDRAKKTKKDAA